MQAKSSYARLASGAASATHLSTSCLRTTILGNTSFHASRLLLRPHLILLAPPTFIPIPAMLCPMQLRTAFATFASTSWFLTIHTLHAFTPLNPAGLAGAHQHPANAILTSSHILANACGRPSQSIETYDVIPHRSIIQTRTCDAAKHVAVDFSAHSVWR